MHRRTVNERDLIAGVVRRTGISEQEARDAVMVVAGELGEALTWGEAMNVADALPKKPRQAMREAALTTGGGNRYSAQSFVRNASERMEADPAAAEIRIVAVLLSLRQLLPGDRFAAIVEELPNHVALLGGTVEHRVRPAAPPPGESEGVP